MSTKISASCGCGKIRFESSKKPMIQLCCHCADCRHASQKDYSTIAFFKVNSVQIVGQATEHRYVSDAGNQTARLACADCGVLMFDKSEGFPGLIGVMADRINAPFAVQPQYHVWVASKLSGVVIPEGSTVYEKGIG
ncbi:GFA family protein [Exilibacterium tricleocarpae]|uniref:GFA family protein n=1 Tax=Exilibacterium tricleocarpae TaxID=2591008 RepID=A0A545U887_9GAMM|nr:GFA family protein [Exilibacterium tricleocarpae]TQV85668.1 GFA family protein [Exilibacterium tricleocarpae]